MIFFIINNYGFGKIDVAILVLGAPTKIIVTAVHSARSALTLNVFMAISGFYNLTAQFALNGVFYNYSHTGISLQKAS